MLEKSTPSQRGEMSRLTLKIKSGVFISNLNARVRDKLWEKIVSHIQKIIVYGFSRISLRSTMQKQVCQFLNVQIRKVWGL